MARGAYIDRSLSKTAFCRFAAMWLAGKVGLRRSSWVRDESYLRRHVVSFFGSYEVGSITKGLIEGWVRGLCSVGLSAGTVR
jgi:integrase-like protein